MAEGWPTLSITLMKVVESTTRNDPSSVTAPKEAKASRGSIITSQYRSHFC